MQNKKEKRNEVKNVLINIEVCILLIILGSLILFESISYSVYPTGWEALGRGIAGVIGIILIIFAITWAWFFLR